jgi:hypothetical protein
MEKAENGIILLNFFDLYMYSFSLPKSSVMIPFIFLMLQLL